LALVALVTFAYTARAAPERRGARLWLEAGPSFDRSASTRNTRPGYGLAGGVEFGRTWALALNAGFEHYPGTRAPEPVTNTVYATPSPILRLEGGGNRTVVTGSVGVRIFAGSFGLQPYGEFDLGVVSASNARERIVDPATGAVVDAWGPRTDGLQTSELGFGLRTHRASGYDGFVGVRFRSFFQLFESSYGRRGSAQISLGIVTP
jgi:hypothetical protein